MKRVRALDKETGEFVRKIHAGSVSDETRHDHAYGCMDPLCSARFHWRDGYTKRENTKKVWPTFARNPSTQHKAGCNYDYEYKAKHNQSLTFYDAETGLFHLRINFPLGASWEDKNIGRGSLSAEHRRVARNRTHYKALPNLESVVKFLEKEFGSLESPSLENLVLHYQGQDYRWGEVFVGAESYKDSFNAAAQPDDYDKKIKQITVMKPVQEQSLSPKGKRRFECEAQFAHTGIRRERLKPVIVCDNSYSAEQVEKVMRDSGVLLVAAKPFIRPSDLNAQRRNGFPCFYNVTSYAQISEISPRYWRYYPARQQTFGDLDL